MAYELQKNGWALLNKIIWHKPNAMPSSIENRFSNVYEPVFLFVKKENKYNYYLSLNELRIKSNSFDYNKRLEEIVGFRVINSLLKDKKITGTISNIFQNSNGNLFAEVSWENKERTIEILNEFDKESQVEIDLICSVCNNIIKNEIEIENHKNCNGFLKPIFLESENFYRENDIRSLNLIPIETTNYNKTEKNKYNGKFKENPDLRGSSPGARKSLFGEYFVLQRRYRIFQQVIAEYLRYWRNKKNINIKEIDKLLGYKDTAGHWFRKDSGSWGRGGSIPLPTDWIKLKKILDFDDIYDKWVTQTHLVLQTVKAHPRGKNPGDLWSIKLQPFSEAHFATFPEELVKKCILAGCPENGIVLDPFAGSGTTGKVAQELNRSAILIELVQKYLDIIKKRCKNIEEIHYVK